MLILFAGKGVCSAGSMTTLPPFSQDLSLKKKDLGPTYIFGWSIAPMW